MRRLLLIVAVIAAALYAYTSQMQRAGVGTAATSTTVVAAPGPRINTGANTEANTQSNDALQRALESRQSSVQIAAEGVVDKLLSDDNDGSRHQRFIVKTATGQTVLVAHNLDLAPRVPLAVGDRVILYGEYEWNTHGGVMHWTHRDPSGRHIAGWIKHKGETYQ